jgi:hypothetical protein
MEDAARIMRDGIISIRDEIFATPAQICLSYRVITMKDLQKTVESRTACD